MKIDTEDNDTTPQSKFVSAEVVQLSSVSPNGSEPSNSLEIDVSIIRTNTTGSSGSYNLERARQDLLQEQTQDPTSGRALVSTLVINGIGALENTSATETGTIQDYQLFPDAKEFVYDISFYDPHGDAALATFSDLIRETVNSFQLLK